MMKLKHLYFLVFLSLVSCQKNKSKAAENLKAVQDTSKKTDTKKKAIFNHRF